MSHPSMNPPLTSGWADGHSTLQHLSLRATRDLQPLARNLEPDRFEWGVDSLRGKRSSYVSYTFRFGSLPKKKNIYLSICIYIYMYVYVCMYVCM